MASVFCWTYQEFVARSLDLDRTLYKLPPESCEQFAKIKKRLDIKVFEKSKCEKLKTTTFVKQQGIVSELFKLLNKVTTKTYEKLNKDIMDIICSIDANSEVCEKFFDVIVANAFYCHLYAKLYEQVVHEKEEYIDILRTKIDEYIEEFRVVKYVSSNEDYDGYCAYVKQTDNIKNFTSFLLECLAQSVLNIDDISKLVITFQNIVIANIDCLEQLNINETYTFNIHLIITKSVESLKECVDWDVIINNHSSLMELNGAGKSKKLHFKLMDISDIIDN